MCIRDRYWPPHDIMGEKIKSHLPRGKNSDIIVELMKKSKEILALHEINKVRYLAFVFLCLLFYFPQTAQTFPLTQLMEPLLGRKQPYGKSKLTMLY